MRYTFLVLVLLVSSAVHSEPKLTVFLMEKATGREIVQFCCASGGVAGVTGWLSWWSVKLEIQRPKV